MVRARRLLLAATLAALLIGAVAGSAVALDALPERLRDGVVGQPYEDDLEAEEGCIPYTFAYDSGNYPPGLVVDPTPTRSEGRIHGTPTAAGWYDFYIEVTDICGSVPSQADMSIFIHPPLVITTSALPVAAPGAPYTAKLTADSGDKSTLEWSLVGGALPAGLALSKDGTISGTTSAAGQFTLVVEVYDRNIRRTQKTLGLTVGSQLTASAPSARRGEVGIAFRATLGSTGGVAPKTWSVATGSLPPGLTLNAATGAIAGRPTTAGSYALTFAVTDASGARATTAAAIGIVARLRIATGSLPAAVEGSPYRARVAVGGGARPVSWTKASGALPTGIRLNAPTGALAGTPTAAGRYRFTLAARDSLGGVARKAFTLVVR